MVSGFGWQHGQYYSKLVNVSLHTDTQKKQQDPQTQLAAQSTDWSAESRASCQEGQPLCYCQLGQEQEPRYLPFSRLQNNLSLSSLSVDTK